MAVKKLTSVSNWLGLSSDTKDTAGPAGSKFWEHDTGITYTFTGVGWVGSGHPLQNTAFANYDDSGDPIYLGYLDKSGGYYIQQVTTATGVFLYSSGSSGYAAAWVNRAAETYLPFNEEF